MANDYTNSLNVAGTDSLLAPAASFIILDSSVADAQVHAVEVPDYYLESSAKIAFKLFMQNGWDNSFTLNVNNLGAKSIKAYVNGVKTDIASTGTAGTVLELFYDGTDYIAVDSLSKSLKTKIIDLGTVTIPETNYLLIQTALTEDHEVLIANINSWQNNSGSFSVKPYKNVAYIVGNAGTVITSLTVKLYYI